MSGSVGVMIAGLWLFVIGIALSAAGAGAFWLFWLCMFFVVVWPFGVVLALVSARRAKRRMS